MAREEPLLRRPPDPATDTVACDLEGTLTAAETWRALRAYLQEELPQWQPRYRRFFVRQMPRYVLTKLRLADRQAFREAWMVGMYTLFAGASQTQLEALAEWVVDRVLWPARREAVVAELRSHLQAGRRVVIITGLIEPIVAAFARRIGDHVEGLATPPLLAQEVFSGRLAGPLNVGQEKVKRLQPFARDGFIAAAYGDTLRDVPILAMSHEPVAVYPDAGLRREAEARGWRILEGGTRQ